MRQGAFLSGSEVKDSIFEGTFSAITIVICVYTYDYQDREDVMRIRQVLRELGIKLPIHYKADEDTSKLKYGNNYTPKYRE